MLRRKIVDILFASAYIFLMAIVFLCVSPKEVEVIVAEQETEVEVKVEAVEVPQTTKQEEYVSLGSFSTTAFCPCDECSGGWGHYTSSGATATEGVTIAVDESIIPIGTKVYIDGHEYIAQDTGAWIEGYEIDIFFEDHATALEWGRQEKEVYVKWEEE